MIVNRKIERRRFLRYMAGFCALLVRKPESIFEKAPFSRIDPLALLTVLRHRVRRDFELGRTIEVDGWILSVTEAELCGMLSRSVPGNGSRHSFDCDH